METAAQPETERAVTDQDVDDYLKWYTTVETPEQKESEVLPDPAEMPVTEPVQEKNNEVAQPASEESDELESLLSGEAEQHEPAIQVHDRISDENEEGSNLFDFDSAVDGLATAVLRDNAWLYSMNNLLPVGEELLKTEGLTSKYYVNEVDCSYPSYRDISFGFPTGSVTAVISSVPFCAYAFVRGLACPEEVAEGSVLFNGKKLVHDDILYIGSDRMLDKKRNTLDWLMSTIGGKAEQKKAKLLPLLEQLGMSNLADLQIESLSYSQRMLVLLIAVSYSSTPVILINDPQFEIEEVDVNTACGVFKLLNDAGKTVLLAGHMPRLMRSVANRVLAIHYGNNVFSGSYRSFIDENCNALVVFHSSDAERIADELSKDGRFEVVVDRDVVEVLRAEGSTAGENDAIEAAKAAGVPVESLRNGDKGFSIAYKEVFKARPKL